MTKSIVGVICGHQLIKQIFGEKIVLKNVERYLYFIEIHALYFYFLLFMKKTHKIFIENFHTGKLIHHPLTDCFWPDGYFFFFKYHKTHEQLHLAIISVHDAFIFKLLI